MQKFTIVDLIMAAASLVISRDGDVCTEGGDLATCGVSEIIQLETVIAGFVGLDSDDVDIKHLYEIRKKAIALQEIISRKPSSQTEV